MFLMCLLLALQVGLHMLRASLPACPPDYHRVSSCTTRSLRRDLSFLDRTKPITAEEFLRRRDHLAAALAGSGVDAFVLEPGYTFQYAAQHPSMQLLEDI